MLYHPGDEVRIESPMGIRTGIVESEAETDTEACCPAAVYTVAVQLGHGQVFRLRAPESMLSPVNRLAEIEAAALAEARRGDDCPFPNFEFVADMWRLILAD